MRTLLAIAPGAETWQPPSPAFPGEVIRAGFFDEQWKFAATPCGGAPK